MYGVAWTDGRNDFVEIFERKETADFFLQISEEINEDGGIYFCFDVPETITKGLPSNLIKERKWIKQSLVEDENLVELLTEDYSDDLIEAGILKIDEDF